MLASSPDSTFDWLRYFQRKYDFHFSAQFKNKNVNFRLTLVNTQSGDASQASLSSGTQESRVSGTEHQTCSRTGCQPSYWAVGARGLNMVSRENKAS